MATNPKYQVFISSTFEDLKSERDQVIRAVLEMGHIPVGMEMFSAADDEQWKIIARHIEESDYYAVLAAHRLGSLTEDGISYTRKEYEYAREKNIPILGFVLDENTSWPPQFVDSEPKARDDLQDFKALIREKPVSFWSSADDLYGKFSVALMKAITANPREGWIRASEAGAGPEITAEVIRLSSENAALRKQLEMAQKDADKEHKDEIRQILSTLGSTTRSVSYRYDSHGNWETAKITLQLVFRALGQDMMIEASSKDLSRSLAMSIRRNKSRGWDIVAMNQLRGLLADFLTLDLVSPSTRKHPISDKSEYWSLTDTGIEVLKAIRKARIHEPTVSEPEDESSEENES
ncbi:DUF4062 domain-containing protein (plasmid) [Glutamicibacter sp. PAEs-4]|uniref:DUF4062 domain-containing protein n=1 Tax=Glutamicibacter sp. PAEs-4 TaxID=3444114 RepID=UPI003EB9152B